MLVGSERGFESGQGWLDIEESQRWVKGRQDPTLEDQSEKMEKTKG